MQSMLIFCEEQKQQKYNNNKIENKMAPSQSTMRFPQEEYLSNLGKGNKVAVSYKFLREIPEDLIEMREDFWDNYNLLVPMAERTFPYPGGIRNPDNFEQARMQEGFVDSKGQGWVKIEFGVLECAWTTFEEAWEADAVQLVHKIFYSGWIYEDCFWWKIKDLPAVLKIAEVICVDSDSEEEVEVESEKGIFDTDDSTEDEEDSMDLDSDTETEEEVDVESVKGIFDTDDSTEEEEEDSMDSDSDFRDTSSSSMTDQEQDGINVIARYMFEYE